MYHYVRPVKKSQYPKIKGLELEGFIRQMNYFCKKFTFLSASNLIEGIYNTKEISPNSMALTFDDGFKDHYLHVFPILKKLNIQGLFFPPAMPIEENSVLNTHKIQFILASSKNNHELSNELKELIRIHQDKFNLHSADTYLSKIVLPSRFDDSDVNFIKKTLQKNLPEKARNEFVNTLFQKYVTEDEKSFSKELYLSYEQIKEMIEGGMYFGAHSYRHELFGDSPKDKLKIELEKGSRFLTKINKNKDSWIMCYPYGNYNETVIQNLEKMGYQAGLTTAVEDAILSRKNAFKLSRYDTNDFPQ
jgi:peptidoglycan/xylan/chitin deacetylase (PgdA/CDA1 family)